MTYASAASSCRRQHRLYCTPANGHPVAAPAAYVSVGTVLGHIAYPPPDVPHSSMLAEGCHCKLLGGAGSCRAATCMIQQQGRHTAHLNLRFLVVYMLQCHLNSHWWVSHQVSQHMPQLYAHRCICHLAAATSVIQMLSTHKPLPHTCMPTAHHPAPYPAAEPKLSMNRPRTCILLSTIHTTTLPSSPPVAAYRPAETTEASACMWFNAYRKEQHCHTSITYATLY